MSEPRHGEVSYLQLPAQDVEESATFYREVFGWTFNPNYPSAFAAAGMHGMLGTDMSATASGGPMLWLFVTDIAASVRRAVDFGGRVVEEIATVDGGTRLQALVVDPAGNTLGVWQNAEGS